MDDTCACGHVLDEHDRHRECTVCPCIHFEAAEAAEADG